MKLRFLGITLALFCSQSVFASHLNLEPTVCPSVNSIKAAGVTHAIKDQNNWIAAGADSHYGTNNEWRYYIELRDIVKNEQEAVTIGNEETLKLSPTIWGPIEDESHLFWGCLYFGENGINGITVTPPDANPLKMIKK